MLLLLNILTFFIGLGAVDKLIGGKIINGLLLLVACVLLYDITTVLECDNETTLLKLPYHEIFNSGCTNSDTTSIEPIVEEEKEVTATPKSFGEN